MALGGQTGTSVRRGGRATCVTVGLHDDVAVSALGKREDLKNQVLEGNHRQ